MRLPFALGASCLHHSRPLGCCEDGARQGDVRGMLRSEINFDKVLWRIPGERMKMRRPHDVPLSRQAASTILNERSFHPDVIGTALAHQDENEIRRAYNRAPYWPERVKLLQAWADMLDEFKELSVGNRRAA